MKVVIRGNFDLPETRSDMYRIIGFLEANLINYFYYPNESKNPAEIGITIDGRFYHAKEFCGKDWKEVTEILNRMRESQLAHMASKA